MTKLPANKIINHRVLPMSDDGKRSVGRPHSNPESEQGVRKTVISSCLKAIGAFGPLKFTIKEVARLAGV
ncbi:MAG: hypothetical protein LBQ12_05525, partial [Deltaproteobacteria bacterium]|nr:hypothetical protein [Deltaproteobacteria bacterium]